MSKQEVKYKIAGQNRQVSFRETELEIEAVFGTENSSSISLDTVTFVDSEDSNNRTLLFNAWQERPTEGAEIQIEISDERPDGTPINFTWEFCTDWNKLRFLAPNELQVGLFEKKGLFTFEQRAPAITFALLEDKNVLNLPDFQNCPYIIKNRKTELEKIQLIATTFITFKSAIDEVHKIINIASDITTLGVVAAAINLATTIASLILLVQRLVALFEEIWISFFPPILYHSGIKPKVFIEKAVQYMGYTGVEFGTLTTLMDGLTWCPSKNDEIGIPVDIINPISGAMKPNDFGYNLADAIEVLRLKYNVKKAIIDNVVHLRPESDPFWTLSPSLTLPNVLVEQAFTGNGTWRPNYEEFFSNRIISYATDDSDYWTNVDLADENDPTSSEKIIAGVIVEPIEVTDQKCVITQRGKTINIPHAICHRKDLLDDLLDLFIGTAAELDFLKELITERFEEFAADLGESVPGLESFLISGGGRSGVMVVENHFFTTAKCLYLEDTDIGFGATAPRIPKNYGDIIGARALLNDWHTYQSLVPGVRNPDDDSDTGAKYIYEEVRIDFNLRQFEKILQNPYFSIPGGGIGKFTKCLWNERKDEATVDFWVETPWLKNVEQKNI